MVMMRSPPVFFCLSTSMCAPLTSRIALMLQPPRPMTREMAVLGTATFLERDTAVSFLWRQQTRASTTIPCQRAQLDVKISVTSSVSMNMTCLSQLMNMHSLSGHFFPAFVLALATLRRRVGAR